MMDASRRVLVIEEMSAALSEEERDLHLHVEGGRQAAEVDRDDLVPGCRHPLQRPEGHSVLRERGRWAPLIADHDEVGDAHVPGSLGRGHDVRRTSRGRSRCAALLRLPRLSIEGLMCIPPLAVESEDSRKFFVQVRELRDSLEKEFNMKLQQLSMGMTNDYSIAVEEGATLVRVGTAIFGERAKPKRGAVVE